MECRVCFSFHTFQSLWAATRPEIPGWTKSRNTSTCPELTPNQIGSNTKGQKWTIHTHIHTHAECMVSVKCNTGRLATTTSERCKQLSFHRFLNLKCFYRETHTEKWTLSKCPTCVHMSIMLLSRHVAMRTTKMRWHNSADYGWNNSWSYQNNSISQNPWGNVFALRLC